MRTKFKLPKGGRKTSLLVAIISLILLMAQNYGWLDKAAVKTASVTPGYYRVTKFFDGDTIAVNMNGKEEKIRFIGVDTPETHDPRKPGTVLWPGSRRVYQAAYR